VDSPHGHAAEAGEEMGSELDAIQERLRALKRTLDARESVVSIHDDISSGDVLSMSPLTGGGDDATGAHDGSPA
jgi:hypothetical protein